MFDKYSYNGRSGGGHHTSTVNVTEKRAPTDESVKLLRDLEKEALDRVDEHIKIQDNVLGDILVFRGQFHDEVHFKFKLNGQKYSFTVDEEEFHMAKSQGSDSEYWIKLFYDKLAGAVAGELFRAAVKDL
jgi:hypothetical protein